MTLLGAAQFLAQTGLASQPRDQEEFVYEFASLPDGWLGLVGLLFLAALFYFVIWMYRREGRIGAPLRLRLVLGGMRCAILLVLALIWLEPVRVRYLNRLIDSYTIVLLDDSSSMDLADTYRNEEDRVRVEAALGGPMDDAVRRRDLVNRLLAEDHRGFLRGLAQQNRVQVYRFSDVPELLATVQAAREGGRPASGQEDDSELSVDTPQPLAGTAFKIEARGGVTNIDRAVRRSIESLGSAPIAGLVLVTDGGINAGENIGGIADYLRERSLPVHIVGVGDPSLPRNIRLLEVLAPTTALQQDPFAVTVRLSAQGIPAGESFKLTLRERVGTDDNSEGRIVETRDVVVGEGGAIEPVTFQRTVNTTGRFTYTLDVPVASWETVADDNSKRTTVNVIEARHRVLLVSGGASWEYRFLSRLLQRDETFSLSCWLQSADLAAVRDGNVVIDHLPTTPKELFAYDAIILMDANPSELVGDWARLVESLVTEYGGGLLVTAARPRTELFMRSAQLKPLIDILPVVIDPDAELIINQIGHYQLEGSGLLVPETAASHPIMRIAGDATSSRLAWRQISDVYWHYPVLREKQVATVLMRHGSPRMANDAGAHVLAAIQYAGAGRTGFLGFDGTWRWRRYGDAVYNHFWVQLLRYLVEGKQLGGTKRGMLLTEGDQFPLGEAVGVTARLFNERFEPLEQETFTAQVERDGERREFLLRAKRDQRGWFEGQFVPDQVGTYRLSVRLPGGGSGGESLEVMREVYIARPNIEVLRPQMNRAGLEQLAAATEGGGYYDIDEAMAIPDRIPDVHEETRIKSRPTTLWDNGWLLTLLLVMLGLEWSLRKWNRLL